MPLTELERANFRQHSHSSDQIIDPDTGDPIEPGGGAAALADLTDVDLTGQADDDTLQRKAGVWVPRGTAEVIADLEMVLGDLTDVAATNGNASQFLNGQGNFATPTGGLTLPTVVQSVFADHGAGGAVITMAQPATTSLLILIGCNNGSHPTSVATTNWVWTSRRNDAVGGVGDLWIYTGEYDGSGTPGTTITPSGSAGLMVMGVVEIANHTYGSLGASSIYQGSLNGNSKASSALLTPAAGSIICGLGHTAGSAATTALELTGCPYWVTTTNGAQSAGFGISLGVPVSFKMNPVPNNITLAEVVLA